VADGAAASAVWERAICSEADGGCGPLIDPQGYESPEQEATPAIEECPVCGDAKPRCRYHWEEHVEDHTRFGAQLVAHHYGWFALDRGDGWYDAVFERDAAQMRSPAYLRVLAEEFAGDESRVPPALRAKVEAVEHAREAFVVARRAEAGMWFEESFSGLAAYIAHWREVITRLGSVSGDLAAIAALGEAARVGAAAWKAECERADRANAVVEDLAEDEDSIPLIREERSHYCPRCGWSRHQTWCYTDRCPWCGEIANA
jgi:hypothetical protein